MCWEVMLCCCVHGFLCSLLNTYPVTVQYLTAEDMNTGSCQSEVVCSVTIHNKHGFETSKPKTQMNYEILKTVQP